MKVLLTATVQSHICQFHKPLVEVLHKHGCEVHVAAKDNLAEKNGLKLDFVDKVYNVPFARSPKSKDNILSYKQLKKIIDEEHYDIVHCNTPMGGIVTRLAARKARKNGTKVFYTAHGFHFYNGAPKRNWLIFYPIEKTMAHFCDKLITITNEDYILTKARFSTEAVHIHGVGVYTERYHPVNEEESVFMRTVEGLMPKQFVILCTGELNQNKNQKVLIEAAGKLKNQIPGLIILLAGNGPLEDELRNQIQAEGLGNQIYLLGYRTDLEKVTPAVNLVVSCSYREGLPLNILEAMLCRKAVIASFNRGHNELVENGITGYLVQAHNADAYAEKILVLYQNKILSERMGDAGYEKAQSYTTESVKKELEDIYFI